MGQLQKVPHITDPSFCTIQHIQQHRRTCSKNYITALIAAHSYINSTEELNIYHNKFITDYDNELYEEIRITELTEKLFGSRDNFIQFIKDSFEQTDEVNSFISKYN